MESNIENLSHYPECPGLESILYLFKMLQKEPDFQNASQKYKVIFIGVDIENVVPKWLKGLIAEFNKQEFGLPNKIEWSFVSISSPPDALVQKAMQELDTEPTDSLSISLCSVSTRDLGVYKGLMRICESHLELASTLVQDIPMKEEANTKSSSSMYGVELIHSKEVHQTLHKLGLLEALYLNSGSGFSRSVGIKWVTPKAVDSLLYRFTTCAFRVTLADPGNRASVCLSQFVLGGRSVVLAHGFDDETINCLMKLPPNMRPLQMMPKTPPSEACVLDETGRNCIKDNPKSCVQNNEVFLLTSHGSIMYIHVLANPFKLCHISPVALVPSSVAAPGLKVDTLQVKQFSKHMLNVARLAPASANAEYSELPQKRAFRCVDRITKYLPLTSEETTINDIEQLTPLFEHLHKEFLEPEEVDACLEAFKSFTLLVRSNPGLVEFFKLTEKYHKKSA
ncbi:hypothetical protein Ciccas_004640 [Cichlidogyrus casuarinus]|uniref:Uncharacterized protein n=1 Tax=Cichlidogyrus casuarinus TaxID=1844966 RepID=A0ABD2QAX9_9PLAT